MTYLTAKGYLWETVPGHPLANAQGGIAVHRRVLYETVGPAPVPCHWCERRLSWDLPTNHEDRLEVDHLDGDKLNNDPSNLVPADRDCNVRRQAAGNPPVWDARPPATCSVEGCERNREKNQRGFATLCAAHRWRRKHHGDVMADLPIGARRLAVTA